MKNILRYSFIATVIICIVVIPWKKILKNNVTDIGSNKSVQESVNSTETKKEIKISLNKISQLEEEFGKNDLGYVSYNYIEIDSPDFLENNTTAVLESLKGKKLKFFITPFDVIKWEGDYCLESHNSFVTLSEEFQNSNEKVILGIKRNNVYLVEATFNDFFASRAHFVDGKILKSQPINN
ncbi:MAG: hypothetical protein ACOCP4_04425 [Candidatus Woesearchaeota archaeon]